MPTPAAKLIAINAAIKVAETLATPGGEAALSGLAKLLFRYGVGKLSIADVKNALILTTAEEAILLRSGATFLIKLAGKFYCVASFLDTVKNFLAGEGKTKEPIERLGIVLGHIVKGSGPIVTAFTASEQLVFGLHDAFFGDANLFDTLLDVVEFVVEVGTLGGGGPTPKADIEFQFDGFPFEPFGAIAAFAQGVAAGTNGDDGTGLTRGGHHAIFRDIDP